MTHQSSVVLLVALLAASVPGAPVPAFLGHLQGSGPWRITMLQIIERLKQGDREIVDYFTAGEEKWKELLSDIREVGVEALGKRLQKSQYDFERLCGNRELGKSVMAWSAFAHLYSCSAGFGDNMSSARKLAEAFEASYCSMEVKFGVKEAAKFYGVENAI